MSKLNESKEEERSKKYSQWEHLAPVIKRRKKEKERNNKARVKVLSWSLIFFVEQATNNKGSFKL
ncbi:MAG: hypothetical protein F6K39_03695 [Okeania sp. SIO3B3]|nr:hypothetical protein [Okeania sp. SIO3B3]